MIKAIVISVLLLVQAGSFAVNSGLAAVFDGLNIDVKLLVAVEWCAPLFNLLLGEQFDSL